MKLLPYLVGILLARGFVDLLPAQTTDFEFLNDWEGAFTSVGTTAPAWGSKVGMGGSGGLLAGTTGYIASVKTDSPISLKPGQSVTIAMSFLHAGQTARIAERNIGLFLTSIPKTSPLEVADGALLAVYLYNVSNSPGQEQTRLGYSTGGTSTLADKGTLDSTSAWWDSAALLGHWLRMEARFTKLPTEGLWELTISLFDLGEDGSAQPTEIVELEIPELSAKPLFSAESVYAGFQNLRIDRGFRAMDNFEMVVE